MQGVVNLIFVIIIIIIIIIIIATVCSSHRVDEAMGTVSAEEILSRVLALELQLPWLDRQP